MLFRSNQVIPTISNAIVMDRGKFLLILKDLDESLKELINADYPIKAVILRFSRDKVSFFNRIHQKIQEMNVIYSGADLEIVFNIDYLIEPLTNLPNEIGEINFSVTGEDKPGVITAQDYTYIILPMKLPD